MGFVALDGARCAGDRADGGAFGNGLTAAAGR
jgi:hypothetical protein